MPEFMARLKTPRLPSAPTSPVVGEMYFNTANNELYHWNGTAWMTNSELTYLGDYNAGTTYYDGDVVVGADGVTYMCVKDGTVGSTPVPWTALTTGGGGYEYGYDQVTTNQVIVGNTMQTVIAGSAHTYDGNAVLAEFFCPQMGLDTGRAIYVDLFEGSTSIGEMVVITNPAASTMYAPLIGKFRFTPSAGSHTYSVKARLDAGASNGILICGPGGVATQVPMFVRFTSVTWYTGSSVGMPSPVINGQWIKGAAGAAVWAPIVSTRQVNASGANIVLAAPAGLSDAVWMNPAGGSVQNIDPTGLVNGTIVTIWNWSGPATTILHMGSSGAGRLWIKTQANAVLSTYDSITFIWDAGLNLWIEVNRSVLSGDPAWQTPTLTDGWTNYGGGFQGARYRKIAGGLVELQGLIQRTAGAPSGAAALTLPAGYRPAASIMFVCQSGGGFSRWDVGSGGTVTPVIGDSTGAMWGYTSLATIHFYADQ